MLTSAGPNLNNADLGGAHLNNANLCDTRLKNADLRGAHLENARLIGAHLKNARLSGSNLENADLRGAHLENANLSGAKFNRRECHTSLIYLGPVPQKHIRAVTVRLWNWLRNQSIPYHRRIKHIRPWLLAASSRLWNWLRNKPVPYRHRVMRGRYEGIFGLSSCRGNRIFVRDASDQDYLDTIEGQLHSRWGKFGFWLWGLTDYGRSIMSVVVFAAIFIFSFGFAYSHWPQMISAGSRCRTPFTPYYFSIVTYTTLGFGDVKPNNLGGEILVSMEVIFGYVTLGLLLAVLGDKIARRS